MLAELRTAEAAARRIAGEFECIREALELGMVTPDHALMHVVREGLTCWLSPWCHDLFSQAERKAERERWEKANGHALQLQLAEVDAVVLKENNWSINVECGGRRVWLKKESLQIARDPERTNEVKITMPAKLAKEKGL